MQAKIYNKEGKETGKVDLPEKVFGARWNADLVHQVVTGMQANARQPWAHAHDRSEQRGGGRKPWRQKGTGRARHGSRRSPLWRGGGVTFGPRKEKDYSQKINKKMRALALYSALSRKFKEGEVLFVETLNFKKPKASDAKSVLDIFSGIKGFEDIRSKKNNAALIAISENDANTKKSFANFGNVLVDETRNLNPVNILQYKYLIITSPKDSVKQLSARLEK